MFNDIYRGKTVFLTGHTGFKGSWLTHWLRQLGASVVGYSLPAPTTPSHYNLLAFSIPETIDTINDVPALTEAMEMVQPDIVIHMAAQALVRESYQTPLETIETNVLGTARVLDVVRQVPSVRAVLVVTSDKCYENPEDGRPLREADPMGGFDPYSMSKGAAELVTASYRNSFFNPAQYGQSHQVLVASGRAGNVIGGGDWAADRLLPDLVRSVQSQRPIEIRNPLAVRPWQHVLEPLSGYLRLGQRLLEGDVMAADGWNFGPDVADVLPVRDVIREARNVWPLIQSVEQPSEANPHEAHLLSLDATKAQQRLGWKPVWNTATAIQRTVLWYRDQYERRGLNTAADLNAYVEQARADNLDWAV